MASYVLIFNQCTLEYLLFPESAVMCFGLLCVILASIYTIEDVKFKWIKVFLLLFLTMISYQGLGMAFPIFVIFLQFLNLKNTKNKKSIIKNLIISAIIMIVAVILEFLIIRLCNSALGTESTRISIEDFYDFEIILTMFINYGIKSSMSLFVNFMNMLPRLFLPLIALLSIILLFKDKKTSIYILPIIIIIYLIMIENSIFMTVFTMGETGRANWITPLEWGMSLIYLLIYFDKNKLLGKIVTIFIIFSFSFNSFMLLQNSSYHTAANLIDRNDGYAINRKIEKYEKETGNKITKFSYIYEYFSSPYAIGIKQLGSLTERALSCPWSINQSLNYYTNRKLELVEFPREIEIKLKSVFNYEEFSVDQIYLENDTMYILVY